MYKDISLTLRKFQNWPIVKISSSFRLACHPRKLRKKSKAAPREIIFHTRTFSLPHSQNQRDLPLPSHITPRYDYDIKKAVWFINQREKKAALVRTTHRRVINYYPVRAESLPSCCRADFDLWYQCIYPHVSPFCSPNVPQPDGAESWHRFALAAANNRLQSFCARWIADTRAIPTTNCIRLYRSFSL